MKLVIGLFALAVLGTAGVGIAAWTGQFGHHNPSMRAIHYDSNYDLSARRRQPAE